MDYCLAYFLASVLLGEGLPVYNQLTLEDTLINTPENDITPISEDCKEQSYVEHARFKIVSMQKKTSKSFRL